MSRKLIYWDSAVFIDWLTDTKGKNQERLPRIRSVVKSVEDGHHRLLASTLVYVEVLENATPGGDLEKLHKFLDNIEMLKVVPVDFDTAKKAQDVRNRSARDRSGKVISTPDAVHIATAIINRAEVFHTSDGQLLSLNGSSKVDGLAITNCHIP